MTALQATPTQRQSTATEYACDVLLVGNQMRHKYSLSLSVLTAIFQVNLG